jgi:hypothetical protein
MKAVFNFLQTNYQWFLSGLGVFIIGLFIKQKYFSKTKQKIIAGHHSNIIQSGRDTTINKN